MEASIRTLSTIEEFGEHQRLQQQIWGEGTIDVPVNLLAASARHGAIVLGAFDGNRMVGMLYGFPCITDGKLCHHSHMLGVLPEYRRRGIGLALKQRQRELVLRQGIDLITWTVDPMEVGNNLFNFERLGVVCSTYIVNAYGPMDDNLNKGLPSDRLEVEWHVGRQRSSAVALGAGRGEPVILGRAYRGANGRWHPEVSGHGEAEVLLIQVPLDMRRIKQVDIGVALEWRLHLRRLFTELLGRVYTIVSCYAEGELGAYVLCRTDTQPKRGELP